MSARIYNFAAGPATMPESVLLKAQAELMDWHGCGMSVMEFTHRGPQFAEIIRHAEETMKKLLSVPEGYRVLFLQGGATGQFAAVPLNLMGERGTADYAVTGNFSGLAAAEAGKYGSVNIAFSGADRDFASIPRQSELRLTPGASYFHYCANNTVYGTAWDYVPETGGILVCDMSSEIMSRPVDVGRYGVIYAGAQKNIAPAGVTVVIVREDLTGRALACTPKILDYKVMADSSSLMNTPPVWCIYMLDLTLSWIEEQGGVAEMERRKRERSALVYDVLDDSRLYTPRADKNSRSDMNVTFRTSGPELDAEFLRGAQARGLVNLKGHKVTGGIRASLYNAMPLEGARALADYMKQFEVEHRV